MLFYRLAGHIWVEDGDDEALEVGQHNADAVQVFRGMRVCNEDMDRLEPGEKLNDELINLFLAVLAEASWERDGPNAYCFSSNLLIVLLGERHQGVSMNQCLLRKKAAEGSNNPPRWPKGTVTDKFVRFWEFDLIFIPLHWVANDHWTLLVLDYGCRRWLHLDPMNSLIPTTRCRHAKGMLERFLVKRAKAQGITISFDGWGYVEGDACVPPQGLNDCGVWVLIMAWLLVWQKPFDFQAKHGDILRERIRKVVLELTVGEPIVWV